MSEDSRQEPEVLQETLFRILEILSSDGELHEVLERVHGAMWSVIDANNLYVALFDEASGLYFFPYDDDDDDDDFAPQDLSNSLTDYVRRTGESLLCSQQLHDELREAGMVDVVGLPSPSWLGAPLKTTEGCIGAVVVQSYIYPDAYDANDQRTLEWIARAMALAVRRQWLEERRQAQQRMRLQQLAGDRDDAVRANLAKSRFLANMSHELRTPLNAILGYSDLLVEDFEARVDDADVLHDLCAIQASARHLKQLIGDVLDLTQVETGEAPIELASMAVTTLFARIEEQTRPLVDARGNKLVLVGHAEAGSVVTDERLVFQALLNLVANACKFTAEGQIALRAKRRGDELALEVADTGVGIDPDQLARLFEPFTQADGSFTRVHGGSGLGLAIARGMVERVGGDIQAGSVPGRGSTFTIRLPIVPPAGAQ